MLARLLARRQPPRVAQLATRWALPLPRPPLAPRLRLTLAAGVVATGCCCYGLDDSYRTAFAIGRSDADSRDGPSAHFEDHYDLHEQLGTGAFGIVHRGRCRKTGRDVAVKIIKRRKETEDAVRHEVAMLQRVGLHRGVAALEAHYVEADRFCARWTTEPEPEVPPVG